MLVKHNDGQNMRTRYVYVCGKEYIYLIGFVLNFGLYRGKTSQQGTILVKVQQFTAQCGFTSFVFLKVTCSPRVD